MGGFKSLCRHRTIAGVVAALLLAPGVARSAAPDDPALARGLVEPAAVRTAAEPPISGAAFPRWRAGLGFGWASPAVDPDLREGFGGSVQLAYGQSLAVELRSSAGYNQYVPPFDNLGVPFASGDITLGPSAALLLRPDGRIDVFAGLGPAWMTSWLGVTWSIGALAGIGGEMLVTPWFGVRLEASYHLFHLAEIGGPKFYDRKSLREVGPIDRLDVTLGPVFRI